MVTRDNTLNGNRMDRYKYSSVANIQQHDQMHGVKRVAIFCLMTTIIPIILIITPLYIRHVTYADVKYPVAESDVLAIADGISTIFCQSQTLKMNSTFNAFQLKGTPQLSTKLKHIRLKKSMSLPDDTLEYWGFFLLRGAQVKLKVCSRYEGSRILVVRGDKNLKTCGLLDHNLKKYGAEMDVDYNKVKVTFENAAEVIGPVEVDVLEAENNAAEDVGIDSFIRDRIAKGRERILNKTEVRRSVANLDAHIKHGGNAYNNQDSSVSSFETDLLTCYSGQILLTEGFPPSASCDNVHYLDKINHMVTLHEVASDGYYYYIFYSDNDFVQNDIHAIFEIYKPTYRYANSSHECINKTECKFDISLFSDETVIVEVPTRDGIEHEGDDFTTLVSTCNPRMSVYIFFPISVLIIILSCAFY